MAQTFQIQTFRQVCGKFESLICKDGIRKVRSEIVQKMENLGNVCIKGNPFVEQTQCAEGTFQHFYKATGKWAKRERRQPFYFLAQVKR